MADVCAVLGLTNPTDVADRLDDEDKARFNLSLPGQHPWFVNESGLYDVVLRSDKPQAKPFRRWVTSEVLPGIRKTGQYTAKPSDIRTFQSLGLPGEMINIIGAIDSNLNDPVAVAQYATALNALNSVFNRDKAVIPSNAPKQRPTGHIEGVEPEKQAAFDVVLKILAKKKMMTYNRKDSWMLRSRNSVLFTAYKLTTASLGQSGFITLMTDMHDLGLLKFDKDTMTATEI